MRKWLLILAILGSLAGSVAGQSSFEEELQQATVDMFDGNWSPALERLRRLQGPEVPEPVRTRAWFYGARALEKLERPKEALGAYEKFIESGRGDQTLIGQARISIVRLAVELFQRGNRQYIDRSVAALDSADPALRFMSAVELSYLDDENLRRKAVPVLQATRRETSDSEIRNQASLALLRIDPNLLEEKAAGRGKGSSKPGQTNGNGSGRMLRIEVRGSDGEEINLTLPLSLARMALAALPEEARQAIRKKGINPDNLVDELSKASEVLEIRNADGVFRLWIK